VSAKIDNALSFEFQLNKILKDVLLEIAEATTKELMETVWTDWYMTNDAHYYQATGQLLSSIMSSDIKGLEVEIYMDAGKLTPHYIANSFSQHMGFDGGSFTDGLIEVIENGNPSPIYSHGGIGMFEKTSKWLEKNLPKIARKVFSKYGIKLSIS
jgi:hypothetical protein